MLQTALTNLSQLTVPGVRVNYGVGSVPETLSRGALPALLVLPLDLPGLDDAALFGDRSEGFEAIGFSSGLKTVTYNVTHLLVSGVAAAGSGIRSHLPTLVTLIDAYFGTLATHITLDGALLEPAQVRVEPGLFTYGGTQMVGCAFRHTWKCAV